LLGNPHAQPPLPTDWDVRPTHPVRSVPYYLAALWDKKYADGKRRSLQNDGPRSKDQIQSSTGRVPKTLKDRLKRSRSAKGLLQDLELEIRNFIESYDGSIRSCQQGLALDDDDYVLIPREPVPEQSRDDIKPLPQPEKLIFQGLEDDPTASFL
jgi:hypothetical protein